MKERIEELRAQADALLRQADEIEAEERARNTGHSLSLCDFATQRLVALVEAIAAAPHSAREALESLESGVFCLARISVGQGRQHTSIRVDLTERGAQMESALGHRQSVTPEARHVA